MKTAGVVLSIDVLHDIKGPKSTSLHWFWLWCVLYETLTAEFGINGGERESEDPKSAPLSLSLIHI